MTIERLVTETSIPTNTPLHKKITTPNLSHATNTGQTQGLFTIANVLVDKVTKLTQTPCAKCSIKSRNATETQHNRFQVSYRQTNVKPPVPASWFVILVFNSDEVYGIHMAFEM